MMVTSQMGGQLVVILAKKNITDYIMRRFEDEKFFRDNKTEK